MSVVWITFYLYKKDDDVSGGNRELFMDLCKLQKCHYSKILYWWLESILIDFFFLLKISFRSKYKIWYATEKTLYLNSDFWRLMCKKMCFSLLALFSTLFFFSFSSSLLRALFPFIIVVAIILLSSLLYDYCKHSTRLTNGIGIDVLSGTGDQDRIAEHIVRHWWATESLIFSFFLKENSSLRLKYFSHHTLLEC